MILKGIEERRREVYKAEAASGVDIIRPLWTIHEVQLVVDDVLKQRFFRRLSDVRKCTVRYTPSWAIESECGWLHLKPDTVEYDGAVGSMSTGMTAHDISHLARGDRDNGHRFHFLRLEFAILDYISNEAGDVHLPRYAAELLARSLITGREAWARPYLKRWAGQMERWAAWLKPYQED